MPAPNVFHRAVSTLLVEIFNGPLGEEAYILNPGDPGLLNQLDSISVREASARPMPGRTTIAAHANHVLYGLDLINRWAAGEENPWVNADWEASWRRPTVDDAQWQQLRNRLRAAASTWQTAVAARADWDDRTAPGAISTVAHTAYHLGAIRQILAALSTRSQAPA